ncbi:MAG: DNA-formamidopyrimidine glycosylase [Desulfobulbaceae bacterium DB1]|nr:MAG: DNA-formamidopyrimidine glycosylase [Desulfobulbaceae bacterium DB1]
MPELPEVEVIRQGLLPHVIGRTVLSIACSDKKLRLPLPTSLLQQWVQGAAINGIARRGKYLLFSFDNRAAMIVHLGMSGKLGIFPATLPGALHDHVVFCFAGNMQMRYNDTRRFGCIQVLPPGRLETSDPFAALGREPLNDDFDGAYLKEKAAKRLQPVKNFLMDSRMVAGIGNIYANEILFYCGIHPTTPVGSISRKTWDAIAEASRAVLTRAIARGGSTISDFVNSSGQQGYFQLELMVYGRDGERCKRCAALIGRQVIGGRSTFFCPVCQK